MAGAVALVEWTGGVAAELREAAGAIGSFYSALSAAPDVDYACHRPAPSGAPESCSASKDILAERAASSLTTSVSCAGASRTCPVYRKTRQWSPKASGSLSRLEARTLGPVANWSCHFIKAYRHRICLTEDPTSVPIGRTPHIWTVSGWMTR